MLMFILIFGFNCTGLKHITEEDPLYIGSKVNYQSNTKLSYDLKDELKSVNKPKPNGKFLWMRPSIAIYNMMGTPKKEKGFRNWVKNKIGKPPVLSSNVSPENVSSLMKNRFFNRGFFRTVITYKTDTIYRKFKIEYDINNGLQYLIDSLHYTGGETELEKLIKYAEASSSLNTGKPYILDNLKSDRGRVEYLVKDSGYYFFDKDFLLYRADTNIMKNRINLQLNIKPQIPPQVYQKVFLNKIYIHDDFSVENYNPDTTQYEGFYYISNRHIFRPDIVVKNIHLHPDTRYSRMLQFRTQNQLSNLGIYRFIRTEFTEDSTSNLLNVNIYATPFKKSALTAELNATIKTTNYIGPGAKISWRHRNVFGGAEELSFSLLGNFEVQVGVDSINTAYQAGLEIGLDIPRPIILKRLRRNKESVPRTIILGGFSVFRRVELYTMTTFYSSFGYSWRKSRKISHLFNPIDISFSRVTDQTDAFREYLENNPTVRVSFEDQFIIGGNYMFIYDDLQNPKKKGTTYFRGILDISGNLTYLFFRAFSGRNSTFEDPYTILGVPFAHYWIINPEFRYYLKTGGKSVLATRALLGIGMPIGNSKILPYIKQFFAGGTNSVRSFVARSIGPGSYLAPLENLGVDQTGDIRIELNAEYRFNFTKRFLGAAFLDVGNVWLRYPDPERPGGEFQLNRFYKEFGIGTGFGFRFDFQFLIFRIDLAWPLYVPYLEEGDRWVIGDINFFSRDWRRDNLLWNFAIGYPF
jgi:outer membrane protein assembly factor BamA